MGGHYAIGIIWWLWPPWLRP